MPWLGDPAGSPPRCSAGRSRRGAMGCMEPIQRETARVIPVSPAGRVLLLRGHDPAAPQLPYWFTIGGQIEPLESARQAAVRELREEVGIVVPAVALVGPIYRGEHSYSFAGVLPIAVHLLHRAPG